jgi:hypothetical protein
MNRLFSFFRKPNTVRLAIAPEVLASLVEKGQLHAADFRCLDLSSKQIVWKILLSLALAKSKPGIMSASLGKEQ